MKIYTLWQHDGSDDAPWLIAACDELTIDAHSGYPPDYEKARVEGVREMVIEIPDSAVGKLFRSLTVKGEVLP